MSALERFQGCLLAGAVGDALGAPVEFMKRGAILRAFGPHGITRYAPAYGGVGTITDDTQMTLFTAEGLLRAWVRGCFKGITTYEGVTARAYVRWLQTQGESPVSSECADDSGWLIRHADLHHRRAPGNTCLAALRNMRLPGEPPRNESKGCGGVMRVAPVGLFVSALQKPPEYAFRLGVELAALTHGHPTGVLSAGVLAVLILKLVEGSPLADALAAAKLCLKTRPQHEETLHAIELAQTLAAADLPDDVAIRQLGEGWVAEEALAVSLYCASVATTLADGIVLAVNHDGDSDSTGSITGNLLGAKHGVNAIPSYWLESLQLRKVIAEVATDLLSFVEWDIGEHSSNDELNQRIWEKYPGH